jgi:lactate dehydrogenase-like 2-hydroxyacid dehydrogenase
MIGLCDAISLHAPEASGTLKIIDEDVLARIKRPGASINTSSPALVDVPSLGRAIGQGWLAFAALNLGADQEREDAIDGAILSDRLVKLETNFEVRKEVRARARLRALETIVHCFRGHPPGHLLIDPAFPRLLAGDHANLPVR